MPSLKINYSTSSVANKHRSQSAPVKPTVDAKRRSFIAIQAITSPEWLPPLKGGQLWNKASTSNPVIGITTDDPHGCRSMVLPSMDNYGAKPARVYRLQRSSDIIQRRPLFTKYDMDYTLQSSQNLTLLLPLEARITPPPEDVSPKALAFSPLSESFKSYTESAKSPSSVDAAGSWPKIRHRRHASSFSGSSRVHTKQESLSNTNLIFSPRPYEDLHTEWAYFTASIQQQTARRADLMKQYSQAEALHHTSGVAKEKRRLRKRLGLLKSKINETVEQEKAMFVRLCELYVEIQSRQTWAQASFQGPGFTHMPIPQTPSTYSATSPLSCDLQTPMTPLNASSPDFIPTGYFEYSHNESACQEASDLDDVLETVVEEGEGPPCSPKQNLESFEDDQVSEGDGVEDGWAEARREVTRTRRLSLPSLTTAWL